MQLHEKYEAQGLTVVTLNMEGAAILEQAKSVARKLDLGLLTNLCLVDAMSDEALDFLQRPDGLVPAVNLYDRSGKLRHIFEGAISHEDLELKLNELLRE